jgi:hypothetical protein
MLTAQCVDAVALATFGQLGMIRVFALSNFPSFTPQISRDFWDDLKYPI